MLVGACTYWVDMACCFWAIFANTKERTDICNNLLSVFLYNSLYINDYLTRTILDNKIDTLIVTFLELNLS